MASWFSCTHDTASCSRQHYGEAFVCLLFILVFQSILSIMTGSVSVIGDTIHLASDTLGIMMTFMILVLLATRAIGKGAMRSVVTVNTLLLFGGGIILGIESWERLFSPVIVDKGYVFFAGAIGWIGNFLAKERLLLVRTFPDHQHERNHTLNVVHLSSDAWMSIVVIVSAPIGAFLGGRVDAIAGLVIGAYIANEGLGHGYAEWTGKHYPFHLHIGELPSHQHHHGHDH